MGTTPANIDRELTDEELVPLWESTTRGVSSGEIPTFHDKEALMGDLMRRLGR